MEAITDKILKITLKLTETEATWLMHMTQNYMGGELYAEGIDERNMRENFFITLKESLEE